MIKRHRLALLISGGGTTMEAIVKACLSQEIPMDVACVIASKESAGGIIKAKALGIEIAVVNPRAYKDDTGSVNRKAFGEALLLVLQKHNATLITQNGWLPLTPENVITAYHDRIFNQHPGPLPETKGLYGIQPHAVMLYLTEKLGITTTEIVVQKVEREFDDGPLIGKKKIDILPSDTPETLQARALPFEHELQIDVLKRLTRGSINEQTQAYQYIKSGEEGILEEARRYARKQYPKG